jgi:glutamine cyclotransferase
MIGVLSVERSYPALGSHLCGMAWDGHHLWYADAGTDRLSCLDVHTGTILQEVVCLEARTGLTSDGTSLWQMAGHPKRIRVIDPADGHIVREIGLGEHAEGMGGMFVDGTSYWLGPEQEGMIEQHSLGDNTVLTTFGVVPSAEGITIIGSTLWYTSYRQRLLAAVDLRTGQARQRYRLPGDPIGMCWDGAQLWYSDYMHRQLCAVHLPVLENAVIPS